MVGEEVEEEVAGSGWTGMAARENSDQHGMKEAAKRAWEVVV